MRHIIILFICLSFLSCEKERAVREHFYELRERVKVSDIVKDYSIVKLETTEDNLIVDPTVVKFSKDRIFILDMFSPSKSLYVFELTGKYVGKVGNKGDGPGEYIMPFHFLLDETANRIYLQDVATNSMLVYALDTFEFIEKYAIPFYANCFELLDEEHFVWYIGAGMRNEGEFQKHIQITDKRCIPQKSMIERMDFPTRGMYNVASYFVRMDDSVIFHHPFMGDYYNISLVDDILQKAFSLRFENLSFPDAEFLMEHKDNIVEDLEKGSYIQWCDVTDVLSTHLCYFGCGQDTYIGKYDEKTGKGWYVNRDNLIDDLGIGVLARPKLGYSATFVSFISLESAGQNITADNSILKDVVSEDDLGGNPILLFYK